jgi:hypothetical protein
MASLGAVSLGYAFCIALLALGGARPGTPPWLSISPETYFRWEAAYLAAFLAFFPAAARVCYGLGRRTAFAVGAGTFLVYQLFLYVFVR